MQLEKTKLAKQIGIAFLGANIAFFAAADTFTAAVSTIDDVTITEKQALDFGTTVFTTVGDCTMVSALPGLALMEHSHQTLLNAQHADYGSISGSSCVTTAGSDTTVNPGVWRISGSAGGTVSILVSTIAQASADYNFTPSGGCYVEFSGDNTDDDDTCETITPGTVLTGKTLAAAAGTETDTSGVGNGVNATAGDLLFTIGGKIDVINPLTAETPYVLAFQVDVTY